MCEVQGSDLSPETSYPDRMLCDLFLILCMQMPKYYLKLRPATSFHILFLSVLLFSNYLIIQRCVFLFTTASLKSHEQVNNSIQLSCINVLV